MGSSRSRPQSNGVYIHGHALSGASSIISILSPLIYPFKSQAKPSILNSIDNIFSLMEEIRSFGRTGFHVFQRTNPSRIVMKAIILVVDASSLADAFNVRKYLRPGKMRLEDQMNPNEIVTEKHDDWLAFMLANRLEVAFNLPILVYANKSDSTNAATAEEVRDTLLSNHLTGLNIRVQECSAKKNEGVKEGWQWLCEQVQLRESLDNPPPQKKTFFLRNKSKRKDKKQAQRPQWNNSVTIGKLNGEVSKDEIERMRLVSWTIPEIDGDSVKTTNSATVNSNGNSRSVGKISNVVQMVI